VKISKIESTIIDFLSKYSILIFGIIIYLLSIVFRGYFLNFQSGDYRMSLSRWYDTLANNGFSAFKTNFANYFQSYLYLMYLAVHLPFGKLFNIKFISMFFDYVCAFLASIYFYKKYNNKLKAVLVFTAIILSPVVVINSACWAQCDIIYAFFLLISIGALINEKYTLSLLFFSIAFCFKLQAIFILPVFLLVYLNKRAFSFVNFLLIPLMYFVFMIPSLIAGRGFMSLLTIYSDQTSGNRLAANVANIYSFIPNDFNTYYKPGLIFAISVILVFCFLVYYFKIDMNEKNILILTLIISILVPFVLPKMHDRYYFFAELFSIIIGFFLYKKYLFVTLIMNFCALMVYYIFLNNTTLVDLRICSAFIFAALLKLIYDFFKDNIILKYV